MKRLALTLVALTVLCLSACASGPAPKPAPDATGGLNRAEQLYAKAYVLWKRADTCSDPEQAMALLNSCIEADPRHAPAFYLRGLLFKQFGFPEDAFENISKAITISPRAEYHAWRAYLLLCDGNTKGARHDLDRAHELDDTCRDIPGIEGAYELSLGNESKACSYFKEAAERGITSWLDKARADNMCSN